MKKKFFILSLVMMLILSLLSVTATAANYSFTVSMTAKNSKVTSGNEVLITVKLSNLNVGENGINSFTAYLSYDTNVFETLTDSSVDGCNGWVPSYTTGTGKVSLYRPTFLKTDEEIMTISLKTKSGLADGTQGEVKLSTIIVSNSSDEIMAAPVSTNITIGSGTSDSTGEPTVIQPSTNTTQIQPLGNVTTQTGNNTNNKVLNSNTSIVPLGNSSISNTSIQTGNTQSTNTQITNAQIRNNTVQVVNGTEGGIPYTGTDSNSLAKIIIGVIFISLVIYIKIERMDKEIK